LPIEGLLGLMALGLFDHSILVLLFNGHILFIAVLVAGPSDFNYLCAGCAERMRPLEGTLGLRDTSCNLVEKIRWRHRTIERSVKVARKSVKGLKMMKSERVRGEDGRRDTDAGEEIRLLSFPLPVNVIFAVAI
jgi:hypothetical protein